VRAAVLAAVDVAVRVVELEDRRARAALHRGHEATRKLSDRENWIGV